LEEKGVSSIIIVIAVVIAIAAAALGGYYLGTRRGGGLGDLPKYSGSQSWNIPSAYSTGIPENVNFAGYTVSGTSVQDLLNWYKDQMKGWTLENELPVTSESGMETGALIYRNGNDGAFIAVISGTGLSGTCYILGIASWSVFESLISGLGGRGAPPNALLSVTATKLDSTHYTLTISHEGGDDLNIADLQLMSSSDSSGTMQTLPFLNPSGGTTGIFSVGMKTTITCAYNGGDPAGKVVTVYIIHKPSKQKIFSSSTVAVQPSTITPPPSVVLEVTARDDPNGVLLTITHHGGDDLFLADLKVEAVNGSTSAENSNIGAGTLTVGYSLQVLVNLSVNPNDVITVYVIHVPTQQRLFADASILVQPSTIAPPNALLSVVANKVDNTHYTLTISHEGGDDLAIKDLKIQTSISASETTTVDFPGSGTFSVGSIATTSSFTYTPNVTGQVVSVYVIHEPSKQKIFSSSTIAVQPPVEGLVLTLENIVPSGGYWDARFSVFNFTGQTLTFNDSSLGLHITDTLGNPAETYSVYLQVITSIGSGETKHAGAFLDAGEYIAFSQSMEGVRSNSVSFSVPP
jgi:hypothetical protein